MQSVERLLVNQIRFSLPGKHFITDKDQIKRAIEKIKIELEEQLEKFKKEGSCSKPIDSSVARRMTLL